MRLGLGFHAASIVADTQSDIGARSQVGVGLRIQIPQGRIDVGAVQDLVEGRLNRIEDHLEQAPNPDWEEEAQEAEMDEVLEGLGQAGTTEIQAIRAALQRIEKGTYGDCVRCGIPGNGDFDRMFAITDYLVEQAAEGS